MLYWIWRLGVWLTNWLPRAWSLQGATWLGATLYYLMPLRQRVAHVNFAHVLDKPADDPAVARTARRAFENYARHLRDVMLYPQMTLADLEARVTIHNPHVFTEALAHGKGAIIVSAHFGNMDLPSAVFALRYAPITLTGETLRPQRLMDWLTRVRKRNRIHLFPYEQAARRILEALKRNEMTAFLIDFGITHHFDIPTTTVSFFGTETQFPTSPAQLALLTGAPIILGHAHVDATGHIDVYTTPLIWITRQGDRHQILQTTMQEIARRMEEFIRLYPEQWYIFRPMWKGLNLKVKDSRLVN